MSEEKELTLEQKANFHLIEYLKIKAGCPDIQWTAELTDAEKIGILRGLADPHTLSEEEFWAGWDEPENTPA